MDKTIHLIKVVKECLSCNISIEICKTISNYSVTVCLSSFHEMGPPVDIKKGHEINLFLVNGQPLKIRKNIFASYHFISNL